MDTENDLSGDDRPQRSGEPSPVGEGQRPHAGTSEWQQRMMIRKQTPEYQAGYIAGYNAGLRKGQLRAAGRHTYRRQHWRCNECGAFGMVLFRDDDDWDKKRERLLVSHEARRIVRKCSGLRVQRLTQVEAQRLGSGSMVEGEASR